MVGIQKSMKVYNDWCTMDVSATGVVSYGARVLQRIPDNTLTETYGE